MKKIAWINITKGIGILTVVAGHIYDGDIKRVIFMFHMPLFFFLSGYLFKPNHELKKYFVKKTIHLLIPYIAFLIPIYYISYFLNLSGQQHDGVIDIIVRPIIGGRLLINETGVFWFVTVLFATQQLMNFLFTKIKIVYISYIVIILLLISYINSKLFPNIWLPLNLNVMFAAVPIFYIGYLLKKIDLKLNYILLLSGITIIVITVIFFPGNTYDMKYTKYGIPIITLISGIVLTLNVKQIAVALSKVKFLKFILSEIGNASMVIMFLHLPVQLLVKQYISTNCTTRFILATLVSFVFYYLFKSNSTLKALFLGSKYDFDKLFKKRKNIDIAQTK